jgi:putative PIN family toxin of toxin-antitoxin system
MGRLRILLDSNILVSALVFGGNELELLVQAFRKGHTIIISEHVEEEVSRTLIKKFLGHSGLLAEFLNLFPVERVPAEKYMDRMERFDFVRDRYDRHILACATYASCDLIVSNDKDLLVLGECQGARILMTRDALRLS